MPKNIFFLIITVFLLFSCASKKDIHYYQNIIDNSQEPIDYLKSNVQINDILFIKVTALIPESAEPFNIQLSSNTNGGGSFNIESYRIQGYLVSQEGNIVFPVLGTLKVAGKSTTEVQELIAKRLNDEGYIIHPTVNVRVINSKVTVLGEVRSPGTYSFDEQNISLNQAIGYAGDLTINGVRKNVLLIREINGVRTYVHLDLTSSSWFNGPYYFVKQNDVIIVNPNGPKVTSSGYLGNVGVMMGVISFALTLFFIFKK